MTKCKDPNCLFQNNAQAINYSKMLLEQSETEQFHRPLVLRLCGHLKQMLVILGQNEAYIQELENQIENATKTTN